jgi:hypothetical protein
MDAADAVSNRNYRALIMRIGRQVKTLDLVFQQFADFRWVELHS